MQMKWLYHPLIPTKHIVEQANTVQINYNYFTSLYPISVKQAKNMTSLPQYLQRTEVNPRNGCPVEEQKQAQITSPPL